MTPAEETTAAEWTWQLVRRIHLGTRKPANWMQLFKFGVVGATGYFVNLAVFAILVELLAAPSRPRSGPSASR